MCDVSTSTSTSIVSQNIDIGIDASMCRCRCFVKFYKILLKHHFFHFLRLIFRDSFEQATKLTFSAAFLPYMSSAKVKLATVNTYVSTILG